MPYAGVYRSPSNSTSPTVFGMVTTDRGDVVELLDTAGAPFAAYRYDAWGNPTSSPTQQTLLISSSLATDIASRQVLRYASYCWDDESKLYCLSARSYDPATRQFISKDPAEADGEESAYQYCSGDPVDNVDATGTYAHAFVPTAYADQTAYFLKVMQVDAGRVKQQLRSMWWHPWDFAYWYYTSVTNGGAWDLKLCMGRNVKRDQTRKVFKFFGASISLDNFGNMHFGYITETYLKQCVGVAGALIKSAVNRKPIRKAITDACWVAYGSNLYHQYGAIERSDSEIDRFVWPGYSTVLNYWRVPYGTRY